MATLVGGQQAVAVASGMLVPTLDWPHKRPGDACDLDGIAMEAEEQQEHMEALHPLDGYICLHCHRMQRTYKLAILE